MVIPAGEVEAALRSKEEQREYERARVAEHYEHNPDVFKHVLDSGLAYATGIYADPGEDLETAQQRKYRYIRNLLDIRPGETALDVGCGWGSNLLYLAAHTEGNFRGITLSSQQRQELLRRAGERGLARRLQVDLCHIEELRVEPGSLDAVLFSGSIVHMRNRKQIHRMVGEWLKPGGRLLISDCYFPSQLRGNRDSAATDHIFFQTLGYCLLLNLNQELAMIEDAGLDVVQVQDLTSSYALTLEAWINNIRRNRTHIDAIDLGFSAVLQSYMTVAKLSFSRRTALEYMILATKGHPRSNVAAAFAQSCE